MNTSAKLQSVFPCSLILGVLLVHEKRERSLTGERSLFTRSFVRELVQMRARFGCRRVFSPQLPTPRTLDWEDAFVFHHISSYSVSPPLPNPITARQFAQYHHHNYEGTSVITHHLFSRPRSCNSTSIQRRKNRISEQWIY